MTISDPDTIHTPEFIEARTAYETASATYDAMLPEYHAAERAYRRSRSQKNATAFALVSAALELVGDFARDLYDVWETTPVWVEVEVEPEGVQIAMAL